MARCISTHLSDEGKGRKLEKKQNLGKLRRNGQLNFCRTRVVIGFWTNIKTCGHFRQANRWRQLSPNGAAPAARSSHTAVWCGVADGMYVFGGWDGSDGCGLSVNCARAAERAGALRHR